MNKRLQRMINKGLIPNRGGVWIDCLNQSCQEEIAGTITTGISLRNMHYVTDKNMNEEIKTEVVGSLSEGKWANMHEQSRRVYGTEGVAPTIHTCGGGNLEPKVLVCAMRGIGDQNEQTLEVKQEQCTNAITTVQKDNLVIEREVLGWSRDEKGNVIDRHPVEVANCVTAGKRENTQNYVKEIELINGTADGLASTLTTGHDRAKNITNPKGGHKQMGVKKTIIYKGKEIKEGDGLYTDTTDAFFHGGLDGLSRGLKANMHDAGVCVEDDDYSDLFKRELYKGVNINIKYPRRYRIRKLTERECFRLMGVEDSDIDKIQAAGISKTQQYKMAGNSIVVDVLYHIFRKMFVETKADGGVQLEMF